MIVIGVDPSSTATGLAAYGNWKGETGLIESRVLESEHDDPMRRYVEYGDQVATLVCHYEARHIWIEDQHIIRSNPAVGLMLAHGAGIIIGQVYALTGVMATLVQPKAWRSALKIRATTTKEAKLEAMAYWGNVLSSHDQAEAACIAVAAYLRAKGDSNVGLAARDGKGARGRGRTQRRLRRAA